MSETKVADDIFQRCVLDECDGLWFDRVKAAVIIANHVKHALAAETKRADEAEATSNLYQVELRLAGEQHLLDIEQRAAAEQARDEANSVYKAIIGVELDRRAAAESARDEAVREVERLRATVNEAKLALDGFVKDACFVKSDSILVDSVMDVVCFLDSLLQPKEAGEWPTTTASAPPC